MNILNKLYYLGRLVKNASQTIISKLTQKLPKLEWLVFEVTDACNSRCLHCNIWKHKPTKDILTAKEVEKILSDDFFNNLKVVLLTGGEPVLRDDIKELIASIHKVRPRAEISLSTNALLPERVLDAVNYAISNNIPMSVGVSLDAIGEKHDLIRGVKGNFQKANYLLAELKRLKEKYKNKMGHIVIGYTISNLTVDTLKQVQAHAQELEVGFLTQLYEQFSFYHNTEAVQGEGPQNYRLSDNQPLINEIKKLPSSFHNEMLIYALRHKLRFRCAALQTFFLLRCDGTIAPCLCYSDVGIGNIRLHSPYEIWHSDPARQVRNIVKKCQGCSNSWATEWSFLAWFFPFLRIKIAVLAKKLLFRLSKKD